MGYGEFGGGGSVQWRVEHPKDNDDGVFQHPSKEKAGKKQREGRTTDGAAGSILVVVINGGSVRTLGGGRVIVEVPIADFKTDQVQLFWGDDTKKVGALLEPAPGLSV